MSVSRCGRCLPCRLAKKDRRYEAIACKGTGAKGGSSLRPARDPGKPRVSIADLAGKRRH